MSKKRDKAKKPHRHRYGGYTMKDPSAYLGERAVLICAKCGDEYVPQSAFMCEPIGRPVYDCPHPTFGASRWHEDDPFVRACLVCGDAKRFTPVRYVGGPRDGEIGLDLITPDDGTSWGSWRISATTRGQVPDESGSTVMFSYTLRFGVDGQPYWEGRTAAERAFDAQATVAE